MSSMFPYHKKTINLNALCEVPFVNKNLFIRGSEKTNGEVVSRIVLNQLYSEKRRRHVFLISGEKNSPVSTNEDAFSIPVLGPLSCLINCEYKDGIKDKIFNKKNIIKYNMFSLEEVSFSPTDSKIAEMGKDIQDALPELCIYFKTNDGQSFVSDLSSAKSQELLTIRAELSKLFSSGHKRWSNEKGWTLSMNAFVDMAFGIKLTTPDREISLKWGQIRPTNEELNKLTNLLFRLGNKSLNFSEILGYLVKMYESITTQPTLKDFCDLMNLDLNKSGHNHHGITTFISYFEKELSSNDSFFNNQENMFVPAYNTFYALGNCPRAETIDVFLMINFAIDRFSHNKKVIKVVDRSCPLTDVLAVATVFNDSESALNESMRTCKNIQHITLLESNFWFKYLENSYILLQTSPERAENSWLEKISLGMFSSKKNSELGINYSFNKQEKTKDISLSYLIVSK